LNLEEKKIYELSMMALTLHILILLFLCFILWCVTQTFIDIKKDYKKYNRINKKNIDNKKNVYAIDEFNEKEAYKNELSDWLRKKTDDIYNQKHTDINTSSIDDLPLDT
tara:strand:+ start:4001 stop:4327 length:327 start_codon:yes stop_codon:yes gene_type:complete